MKTRKENIRIPAGVFLGLLAGVILFLYLNLTSDEGQYPYTIKQIFKWAFYPCLLIALWLAFQRQIISFLRWLYAWKSVVASALCALGITIALKRLVPWGAIPWPQSEWINMAWLCVYACAGICFAALAAKLNNWVSSSIFSLLAMCAILLAGLETYYLFFPPQWHSTALHPQNASSKHVLAGEAQPDFPGIERDYGRFPAKPAHPSASVAHHQLMKDKTMFDVRYTFDDAGHRITPPANASPAADLLLFGCSYTFGYGLENEETWAWRLSELLGPAWLVTNYAYNAFGAQQMLALLEEKAIQKPDAPVREAFFLALESHIYRFSGLFSVPLKCIRYALRDGKVVRDGFNSDSPYYFISVTLPDALKGSQAVRQLSLWLAGIFMNRETDNLTRIYVAMLEKSAFLLRDNYGATLTVILWPDIERIRPDLEKAGIKTILMRDLLKDWDAKGPQAYVEEKLDNHPNQKATREIADGLYIYLKKKDPALFENKTEMTNK